MKFTNKRLKIFNYFLLLIWMGVIFYLSGRPFLSSGMEVEKDFVLRKIAHLAEYAILAFLFYRALKNHKIFRNPILWSAIFSILYAVSDEAHQLFVLGRAGKAEDVLIDSAGIVIAGMAIWRKNINNVK